MGYEKTIADFDTAIMELGDRFVAQVQPVLHPQSLAVTSREVLAGWHLPGVCSPPIRYYSTYIDGSRRQRRERLRAID